MYQLILCQPIENVYDVSKLFSLKQDLTGGGGGGELKQGWSQCISCLNLLFNNLSISKLFSRDCLSFKQFD